MAFLDIIGKPWVEDKFVSVGLDSNPERIPECVRQSSIADTIFAFNREIIEATADLVCVFKPNIAFYERYGIEGLTALLRTMQYLKENHPSVFVILDAKRGDIGNTNLGYVDAAFVFLLVDAITVHPYLGRESLEPFLDQTEKGIFVLCRTSNPGAGEFQDLEVNGTPLYLHVARQVAQTWNQNGNCALVVGATYPEELAIVRAAVGDLPILIPGIGAQGGDVEKSVKAGLDSKNQGIIVNSSRGIIFASEGKDFAEAARKKTEELSAMINQYR